MYIYSIIVKKKKIVCLFYIYGFILEKIEAPKTCGRIVYVLLETLDLEFLTFIKKVVFMLIELPIQVFLYRWFSLVGYPSKLF